MSSKAKADVKVPILKGQEAEDKVLEYLKRMNRPYGAVDVAANLKGAVPKATTQKILITLAEKGDLVQKTYGKTTFFVVNQAKIDSIPADKLAALEIEQKEIDEKNKILFANLRTSNLELTRLKNTPTDLELDNQIENATQLVNSTSARLQPLRLGAPLMSAEELAQVNADWTKWRAEWDPANISTHGRMLTLIYPRFWQLATDVLPPQDAASLAEDLGIELDSPEHAALERSPFCICLKSPNSLKRKR